MAGLLISVITYGLQVVVFTCLGYTLIQCNWGHGRLWDSGGGWELGGGGWGSYRPEEGTEGRESPPAPQTKGGRNKQLTRCFGDEPSDLICLRQTSVAEERRQRHVLPACEWVNVTRQVSTELQGNHFQNNWDVVEVFCLSDSCSRVSIRWKCSSKHSSVFAQDVIDFSVYYSTSGAFGFVHVNQTHPRPPWHFLVVGKHAQPRLGWFFQTGWEKSLKFSDWHWVFFVVEWKFF